MEFQREKSKIFLIGDSISIHYGPYLSRYLKNFAELERKQDNGEAEENLDVPKGANGGDSRMVLGYLKSKLREPGFDPDYLLLNCGLHDIKWRNSKLQVDSVSYQRNLNEIFNLVMESGISLIWIRTTPVIDSIHNSRSKSIRRHAKDVNNYNRIADEVCKKYNIPVIDLFHFSQALGDDQISDHVHYRESARALQAAYIAGSIQNILNTEKKMVDE